MKRTLLMWMALIALVGGMTGQTAYAQPDAAKPARLPLYVTLLSGKFPGEGDIYAWNGGFSKKTSSGHNFNPVMSPTGEWVVYSAIPAFYVKQRPPSGSGSIPTNIVLLNVATSKTITIADQPAAASLADGKIAYTLRSNPSWSPDGATLAWTEITIDQAANVNTDYSVEQLVTFDLGATLKNGALIKKAPGAQTLITPLAPHRLVGTDPVLSDVAWGPDGIAVVNYNAGSDRGVVLYVYDTAGKLIAKSDQLISTGFDNSTVIWVKDGDKNYITNVVGDPILDPKSGAPAAITDQTTPELYSPSAPDGLSIYYGSDAGNDASVNWTVAAKDKVVYTLPSVQISSSYDVAISPDGLSVGYVIIPGQGTAGGLFVYHNGTAQAYTSRDVGGMAWAPAAWRLRHTAPP